MMRHNKVFGKGKHMVPCYRFGRLIITWPIQFVGSQVFFTWPVKLLPLPTGPMVTTLTIETQLAAWLSVHATLCLGLRDPTNTGASRAMTEEFANSLGQILVQQGIITQQQLDESIARNACSRYSNNTGDLSRE